METKNLTLEEQRILIADFMREKHGLVKAKIDSASGGSIVALKDYDGSWDELMPVVEKIESLEYEVSIDGDTCEIYLSHGGDLPTIFTDGEGDKRKATFEAVLLFIKWYNEN